MTVADVYDRALGLMYATSADKPDYNDFIIPVVNVLLGELFVTNNAILLAKEEEPLTSIPYVTAVGDTLTYEDEVLVSIIPYGIAGILLGEDPSTANLSIQYKNKYEEQKLMAKCGYYTDITDNYEDEE